MTEGCKSLIKFLKDSLSTSVYQEPVSSQAKLPYVSLSYSESDFAVPTLQSGTIWTRDDSSYGEAYAIADELGIAVPTQGTIVSSDKGVLWVKRGSPFTQNRLDEETNIRAVAFNLEVTAYFSK